MDHFHYRDGHLYCEDLSVADLADRFGTPLYVYSKAAFVGQLKAIQGAFAEVEPLVCYAIKANSNLSILKLMADHGSGFDVVSGGELDRVLIAGGKAGKTVFAGVGKTDEEIAAGLKAGVLMFNVESEAELDAIAQVSDAVGIKASVALRVNPDVDPKTHRYTSTGQKESKFGMDIDRSLALAERSKGLASVAIIGVHMHIGSQITTTEPYAGATGKLVDVIARLRSMGHPITWFNMGGGFGIGYRGGEEPAIAEFAKAVMASIKATGCRIAMEPGAGDRRELRHPGQPCVIYQAVWREAVPDPGRRHERPDPPGPLPVVPRDLARRRPPGLSAPPVDYEGAIEGTEPWDVVGPVCESGDFLAKDRALPPLDRGALLATFSAGAYGMVMASNYNTRPRAAEILVDGSRAIVARRRETLDDLIEQERAALGQSASPG